jgi:hypothetical protein
MTKLTVAFRNFANAPENITGGLMFMYNVRVRILELVLRLWNSRK